MIEITDTALQTAAAEGIDAFLRAFTDKYREALGGDPTAETISRLNGEQHSLLAYRIFRDEVTEGGFCQLIQNGYGVYIFDNPFARVMRLWGAERFSKLVYAAKKSTTPTAKTSKGSAPTRSSWPCTEVLPIRFPRGENGCKY